MFIYVVMFFFLFFFFIKYDLYQEENIHPNVVVYVCEIKPTFTKQLLQFRD